LQQAGIEPKCSAGCPANRLTTDQFFNHSEFLVAGAKDRGGGAVELRGEEENMSKDLDRVSLKSAIAALRHQIKEAAEQAAGLDPKEPRFRIEKAELELTVVAEDTTEGGVEVGWWLFKGSAKLAGKDAVTHKVKLTLNTDDLPLVASHR
jgi:hypothetical protein